MARKEVVDGEAPKMETPKVQERQTVTVHIDDPRDGEAEVVYVSVNGKTYTLNRGEDIEVPVAVAEVLKNSKDAMKKHRAYIKAKEYKPQK